MSSCDEYRVKTLLFLDNDLHGQELEEFLAHLETCADCREHVEAEESLSRLMRRSRPLYSAPDALRARVSAAMEQTDKKVRPDSYKHLSQILQRAFAIPARRMLAPAALVLLVALFIAFTPNVVRQARATSYVETAVATHRSYVDGELPLQLQTSSSEEATAWFADKVPFPFRLPNAQTVPGSTPMYQLTGAGLVHYRGNPVALVTYEKQNEKISLLVASSNSAVVAGGDEIHSGPLTFHYRVQDRFRVITWTTHGLSYAMVFSGTGSAQQSCLVCHQNMADHRNFGSGQ